MDHDNDKHTSAIAVMTEIFISAAKERIKYSNSDIEAAIHTTWLPIFRSTQTLVMAINAVRASLNDESVSELCDRYLECLEATK